MASSYTPLLGFVLPVTGELAGTWGTVWNNEGTSLLDSSIAGTTTLSTDADVTLTTTTGASNQARQAILLCSGARTALRTITAPAQSKIYVVINSTTGGFGVKLVGAGPTTGVTVAAGKTAVLVWNGSDFVEVAPATATTATNLAGGAAGSVPYQTAASTTTMLAIGANNYVLTSTGTAPTWTANTGTGNVVRATSPTLTTPTLGVASATSINKVTITAPVTSATLTIADGKTLTANNTVTFTGTDAISVALGGGGTVAYTGNNLSVFAPTTSAQLAGIITDETGSGSLVFASSPQLTTPSILVSAQVPLLIGGTSTASTLTLRSTSGVGTTGADIIFQTGNNGATEAMRVLNSGTLLVGQNASRGTVASLLQVNNSRISITSSTAGIIGCLTPASAANNALRIDADPDDAAAGSYISLAIDNLEYARLNANGNLGVATTSPLGKFHVSFSGGSSANSILTAVFGADTGGVTTRTDATTKDARLGLPHYTNAQSAAAFAVLSSTSTENIISIGGGTGSMNAATMVRFLTAANNTTLNGTERLRIDSSGNVGIGTSSPTNTLSVAGNANITGNVTLGDASTDTVLVNGYMGVGIAANAGVSLRINSASTLTGTTQRGLLIDGTASSASTTSYSAAEVSAKTQAAAYTAANVHGLFVTDATKGAGSTITNQYGIYLSDQTQGTNNYAIRSLVASGANKWNIYADGTAANYFAGNVGIGTSSPGTLLQIGATTSTGGISALIRTTTTNLLIGQSGGAAFGFASGATSLLYEQANTLSIGTAAASPLVFGSNGAERMRIDSAGNVGIGVTPSAWDTYKVLQIGSLGSIAFDGGSSLDTFSNAYYATGAHRYISSSATAKPSRFTHGNGAFYWFTAPAGTAGNAITYTQSMLLDPSGNLGIGVTPSAWASFKAIDLNRASLAAGNTTTGLFNNVFNDGTNFIYKNTATAAYYQQGLGEHRWYNAPSGTAGTTATFTQAMTLDASGNLGIGTISPVNKLQINGSLGRNAPVTKTGNFTLADTENWLICNGTATITVTLPAASSWTGREVMIKNTAAFTVVSASSNVVPLAGGAAGTAILPATAGAWATLVSDGTNWIIMQS